ncbi:MAG TPA: hypothetical protein VH186_29865 [Chloroflexia bacterium]|nr:hypothetical protein [Chloroflexia bacterium]
MRQKGFDKILVSAIAVIGISSLFMIGLAIFFTNSNKLHNDNSVQTLQASQTRALVGAVPDSVIALTPSHLASTPAPTVVEQGVTIINPNIAVGDKVLLPLDGQGTGIKLIRTLDPPLISLQEARSAVYNRGISWALGGNLNGQAVTLTAAYGLVTIGSPTATGNGWLGPQNIPLSICTTDGKCSPTNAVLNHIENRPMWVLDYGNTNFPANGPACVSTPCPTPQIYNHSVYTVNAQTRAVITADFYTAP